MNIARTDSTSLAGRCEDVPTLNDYLTQQLSFDHKAMYITLLQARLTAKEQYPVEFDKLWGALGYTRKDNAKRQLDKCVNKNEWVLLLTTEERLRGGHNKEDIRLTLKGAQLFAMAAQTEQGKEWGLFFIEMVAVLQDYHVLSVQHDKQRIEEEKQRLEEEKQRLEEENKALTTRLDAKYVPSQMIYVIRNQGLPDKKLVKIGISGNFKNRKGNYKTSMPHGVTTEFWLHCIDASLCEKIVNRVLEEFCFNGSEWFQVDMIVATSCITAVVAFVDGLITNLEAFAEAKSHERIEQLFEDLPQDARSTTSRASLTERITDTLRGPVKRTRKIASSITQYFKRDSDSAEEEQASSPNVGTSRSHSMGSGASVTTSSVPPQDIMDEWLEDHLEHSSDGRVHLHRLMKAFGEFMSGSERPDFPTPSSSTVERKLCALGYELTKNKERQRDTECYCKSKDRFVKAAVLKP